MQAKGRNWRVAIAPIAIAAGFAIILLLSNHPATTPEGLPVITDQDSYNHAMLKARNMSQPIFEAYDNGVEPTDAQKATLRQAAMIYDSASRFDPVSMEQYFSAGKAYEILGDNETADTRLRQLIDNVIYNETEAGKNTVIEAKNLLSEVRGFEGQWQSAYQLAADAVKAHPDSAIYHTTLASAEIQLKKLDDAKKNLGIALYLDPKNRKALLLAHLIQMDAPPAPKAPAKHS